ncbi:tetratricopeptide repeat protein [Dactylosporangium cerinum]
MAWINAESGPVTGLAGLARVRGLGDEDDPPEQLAAAAVRLLESDDRARRLVVFDNVDDPDALAGFLPARGTAKVIITSNRQEFTTMPGITTVPVGMFTQAEGLRFLREATGLADTGGAVTLGVELGWLPLGLAQAAAYIARNRLSYRQYLTVLAGQDLDETLRRQAGTDHPGVLQATTLSLAGLGRDDPPGDASRLLAVLAVLSPDGISRRLLATGAAAGALGLTGGLGHALDILATTSLITLGGILGDTGGGDGVVVSVHRLTARVIRHQADNAETTLADGVTAATGLLDALTDDLPLAQVALRRAELDELVGHILALRGHTEHPPPLLLIQCAWAGDALHEAGDLTRAVPVLTHTLTDRLRVLGADHPDTLASRSNLAGAYQQAGRLAEAIDLYNAVLADSERVLGIDHPDTMISRNNLANAYRAAGRLAEAIALFRKVFADSERVLGPDHPQTLFSGNQLAGVYRTAGRLAEATALFGKVLADRERVLGPDHPDTLNSRHFLALAYESAGRLAEAIDLHTAVLADRLRVLGPDHPWTLTSRHFLAGAYRQVGRLAEAIDLYNAVLADRLRLLGPDHPWTLATRHELAGAYRQIGRLDEAIDLYNAVLADSERVLGPDHPITSTVREDLATARTAESDG